MRKAFATKGPVNIWTLIGMTLLMMFLISAGTFSLASKSHTWNAIGVLSIIGAMVTVLWGFKKSWSSW